MAQNKTEIKNKKCYVSDYIIDKIDFENLLSTIYFFQNEGTLNERLFSLHSKFSIYVE